MSHKVCSRCLFVVPAKKKLCTTCGSKSFMSAGVVEAPPAKEPARHDFAAATIEFPIEHERPLNHLRQKFAESEQKLPPVWWEATWSRVMRALGQ